MKYKNFNWCLLSLIFKIILIKNLIFLKYISSFLEIDQPYVSGK